MRTWRYRVTVAGDWLAKATFWMKSGPAAYPTLTQFEDKLSDCGLMVSWQPLWGSTPFNNYLITANEALAVGSARKGHREQCAGLGW